jgi:4-hydroxy-2-oxoheptanedioate aldolase
MSAAAAGPDRVRERWRRGEPAFNLWVNGVTTAAIEEVGRTAYDSVLIDMQHDHFEFRDVLAALITLGPSSPSPIIRVPSNDAPLIGKVLDAGAYGVVCPQVEDRAAAEAFVRATRHAPAGGRSFGPLRPAAVIDEPLTLAQIESVDALAQADEIASVPGLDALLIGPADLSISAGGPAELDCTSPVAVERHQRLVEVAHRAGIKAGMIAPDFDTIGPGLAWGMDLISIASTQALMLAGADAALRRAAELSGRDHHLQ